MKRSLILAALLLSACAVGPNYERPKSTPTETGGFVDPAVQRLSTTPASGDWWKLFDDPALDRLVGDALAYNTDVREAAANLAKARAVLSEARGARLPATTVSGGYQRIRVGAANAGSTGGVGVGTGATTGTGTGTATGGATTGPTTPGTSVTATPSHYTFDYFTAGFDASYEVDLFGRVSRSIEAARGDAAASAADLDSARIAVAAETARTYASACASAAQANVARETAELQGRTLDLTRRLLAGGRGTQREVDQATVLAENAAAQVPVFEAERRASLYALAVLTGRPPAEVDGAAAQCATPPRVTTPIPVGDGAALLARRPDVRASERRLAGQTARIGVATAALYPTISLGGSASLGATKASQLGKAESFGFSLGPLISWSFPNISVARARVREERAETAAALARFDGTVLTALSETEQALARYAGALDRDASLTRAAAAAENAARLSRLRFDNGRDSFLQLLDAERDRASARAALAQSRATVADDQVSLFKALGGGWENSPPVDEAERR